MAEGTIVGGKLYVEKGEFGDTKYADVIVRVVHGTIPIIIGGSVTIKPVNVEMCADCGRDVFKEPLKRCMTPGAHRV